MSHGFARNGLVSTTVAPIRQEWQRPSDWLSLPTVSGGDQKLVGLYKIINGDNWFAVSVTGAYTIDWGDGTTTNTASGTTTYKNLSWSSYSGSTATTDGFRQAIITITPQSGSTLTSVNLNVKHNQSGLPAYATGWLDVKMAGASLTTLTVGGSTVYNSALKRFEFVGGSALTYGGAMFQSCYQLATIVGTSWTSGISDFTNMFQGCSSLSAIPLINTAAGTSFANMFWGCSSLSTIPLINTAAGTSFTNMFWGCSSLESAPLAGTRYAISYASCALSSAELDAIYTGLGTAAGSQTITVSGNYGTTGDTPSIATGKGWTVTGS